MKSMPSRVPDDLKRAINDGSVMLVVGSGVSSFTSDHHLFASWKGLLEAGLKRCVEYGSPALPQSSATDLERLTKEGDIDGWLAVATLIERKLRYPNSNEWITWIQETVGDLPVKRSSLIRSILSLNSPIITTNYDRLLTDPSFASGRQIIDWDSQSFEKVYHRNPLGYILHLHGSADKPEGVVLGVRSYSRIVSDERVQTFLKNLLNRYTFLFVGFGGAFEDPNIQPLVDFINSHGSPNRNYALVRGGSLSSINRTENIYPLSYGDSHENLPSYVSALPFGSERLVYQTGFLQSEAHRPYEAFRDTSLTPEMVFIEPGSFSRTLDDGKVEIVDIETPFAIGKFTVSLEEWEYFCSEKGPQFRKLIGDRSSRKNPAVGITHSDAVSYVGWLSDVTGHVYRLPSENEWEYVARAGTDSNFWWGDTAEVDQANFRASKIGTVSMVDQYPLNPFGVSGQLGNVWEWCDDHYQKGQRTKNQLAYRFGDGGERVLKGGCFYYGEEFMHPVKRIHLETDAVFNSVSFRVVREIPRPLTSEGDYYLVSRAAPLCLTVKDGLLSVAEFSASRAHLWKCKADEAKQSVSLMNVETELYLAAPVDVSDYAAPELKQDTNEAAEWRLQKHSSGYMLLKNASNKALDLEGGRRRSEQSEIILFEKHGNFNQVWTFISSEELA